MSEILPMIILLLSLLLPYAIFIAVVRAAGGQINNRIRKDYSYAPQVTIFLPTFNEEEYIEKKLDNLLSQKYPIHEILIYDCSTDRTALIVEEYRKKCPFLKLVRQPTRIGMAQTINQAFNDATGDIFIKTDCDSIVKSDNGLGELVANFADSRVGGATGICVSEHGVEKLFRKFMTSVQIAETNFDSTVIAHASSLLAFRRSVVEPVDVNSMADDTEEFVLIRKKGCRTIVDPKVVCVEDVPSDFRKRRLQKDRRAEGIIRVLLGNISMLFDFKYGKFGLVVMPIELFILVLSPLLLIAAGIAFAIILYIMHPVLMVIFICAIAAAFAKRSGMLSAIIDTQLSGLIGTIRTVIGTKSALWQKVR
jgi:cellulose synthase/poly-beta-1,6-N-acetylglucosamine synthase-like glycosyltransferase